MRRRMPTLFRVRHKVSITSTLAAIFSEQEHTNWKSDAYLIHLNPIVGEMHGNKLHFARYLWHV